MARLCGGGNNVNTRAWVAYGKSSHLPTHLVDSRLVGREREEVEGGQIECTVCVTVDSVPYLALIVTVFRAARNGRVEEYNLQLKMLSVQFPSHNNINISTLAYSRHRHRYRRYCRKERSSSPRDCPKS